MTALRGGRVGRREEVLASRATVVCERATARPPPLPLRRGSWKGLCRHERTRIAAPGPSPAGARPFRPWRSGPVPGDVGGSVSSDAVARFALKQDRPVFQVTRHDRFDRPATSREAIGPERSEGQGPEPLADVVRVIPLEQTARYAGGIDWPLQLGQAAQRLQGPSAHVTR